MADSQDKTPTNTLNNFKDDLDAMLDEASLKDYPQEFIDDEEEAIDRLLMGDTLEKSALKPAPSDEDIDKLLMAADSTPSAPKPFPPNSGKKTERDIDTLLDKVSDEIVTNRSQLQTSVEMDDTDDYDEFAGFENEELNNIILKEPSTTSQTDEASTRDEFDEFALFDDDLGTIESVETSVASDAEVTPEIDEFVAEQNDFSNASAVAESISTSIMTEPEAVDREFEEAFGELDDAPRRVDNQVTDVMIESVPVTAVENKLEENLVPESTPSSNELPEDDFLIADFDITSDEDEFNAMALDADIEANPKMAPDDHSLNDAFSELDDFLKEDEQAQTSEPLPQAAAASNEQNEILKQLSELRSAQELLKQQIAATATAAGIAGSVADDLALLTKEQKSVRRFMEEINAKKAPGIVYVAIALGALALLSGGAMLAMYMRTNSDFEALKQRNVLIENELVALKNAGLTATGGDVKESIIELTQKVEKLQAELTTLDKIPQTEPLQASTPAAQADFNNAPKKAADVHQPIVESASKAEQSASPTVTHDVSEKSSEPVVAEKASHKIGVEKPPRQSTSVKAPPKKNLERERPARVIASVVKKTQPKPVPFSSEEFKGQGRWTANLVSFRQDWYAKRKAVEFAQRGIFVEVIPAEINGETWYRLRTGGFANRAEANNYAAKAKRLLNLTSVWVTVE